METNAHQLAGSGAQQVDIDSYQELLTESEQMLGFGTWSLDIASGILQWSDQMKILMGCAFSSIPASLKMDFYINLIVPEDQEGFRTALNQSISGKSNFNYTYSVKRDLKDIVAMSKAKWIIGASGSPAKLLGVTKDITIERDYQQSMKDKVRELDRSNKELEEFAYIASHDLQEPLRKITSFSERLREKLGDALGPDSQAYLNRMLAATDNMRLLIDSLLEFSRTNRYSKPFERTDLNTILAEVRADLELKIEETGAIINSNQLPIIDAIPSQIRQLFNNLLNNAIKFRKTDQPPVISISGRMATKEEKEHHAFSHHRTAFLLSVNDNGIGFEQEYEERIFQLFQRLHGKSEYPGSGIGLAICKKIVENHKGFIFAEGHLGSGAEFTFIVPENQI